MLQCTDLLRDKMRGGEMSGGRWEDRGLGQRRQGAKVRVSAEWGHAFLETEGGWGTHEDRGMWGWDKLAIPYFCRLKKCESCRFGFVSATKIMLCNKLPSNPVARNSKYFRLISRDQIVEDGLGCQGWARSCVCSSARFAHLSVGWLCSSPFSGASGQAWACLSHG